MGVGTRPRRRGRPVAVIETGSSSARVVAYLESAFGGEVVVEGGAAGPERSFTRGRIRR